MVEVVEDNKTKQNKTKQNKTKQNRVILPNAKLISEELQQIGKLTPIIYPINQDIVFDFFINQYKDKVDYMDIICCEKSEEVHSRLDSYKSDMIRIIDIPEVIDLAHTIYYGLKDIEEDISVIINFSDTIVMENIFESEEDCFYYSEEYKSDVWTFFEEEDGKLTKIYDKLPDKTKEKGKLFVGVFQFQNIKVLKDAFKKALESEQKVMNPFYYALKCYSEIIPMKAIYTDQWFDIGHIDKYYESKLEVKTREFNHITIDKERGILRKTSDNKEKFIGEVKWYLKLPSDLSYVRPRIFSFSIEYENPYVDMEYYSYHTLHELFLYGDLSCNQWRTIFEKIKFVLEDFSRYQMMDDYIVNSVQAMYLDKTMKRLELLKKDKHFVNFFEDKIEINGKRYLSLNSIIEKIKVVIPQQLYQIEQFHIIHGDLCFANIMVDTNFSFIKIIDPRGEFGKYDIYGDRRYEFAKLLHSVEGKYDFIIKNMFEINVNAEENKIQFEIKERDETIDIYKVFQKVFENELAEELEQIQLIESLLFFSMIPLHMEDLNHQYAMLCQGIQILDKIVAIKETEGEKNVS